MDRWSGRVGIVTGASAGIGAAIAQELVKHGMKVVGIARRVEKVEALAAGLKDAPGKLYAVKADVSKEEDILAAFDWVEKNLGGVDVLVNNAGVGFRNSLIDGPVEAWREILDINVLGLCMCTKEAIKSMKERKVDDGHIIHISSIAGHYISNFPGIGFYSGSKHAVRALTEGLRQELRDAKSHIRVTCISPGVVKTEIWETAGKYLPTDPDRLKSIPFMEAEDLAAATVYVLGAPPHVQVHDIIIRPLGETL